MTNFSKESLAQLRQKIDLVELLSSFVPLKRSGASWKGLCPFHEEKTPSFILQPGDSHYHCFGCGAHGDGIQFLMTHQKMSFSEAVEFLAARYGILLERGQEEEKGTSKALLKEVLERATQFFHFLLLHTEEGQQALSYLYGRGFSLDFLKRFFIGFSSKNSLLLEKFMEKYKISSSLLEEVGLITFSSGKRRDFFSDRIMIPIQDAMGTTIGFSARKFKEDSFGPKYINTPETLLFKKSKVLFGLSYSRQKIAKERKALIVEGQWDALRLIYEGFSFTVAGQGTAFTEEHVKQLLNLGVNRIFLALDPDSAGQTAAVKIGHLFQKEAIEVFVLSLPEGMDPDLALREQGPKEWERFMEKSEDYLSFLVRKMKKEQDFQSPAGKNEALQSLVKRIREWSSPIMVYESLKKLAKLTQTPPQVLGIEESKVPELYIQRSSSLTSGAVDTHRLLEMEVLRWLFLMGENTHFIELALKNLSSTSFSDPLCKKIYEKYLVAFEEKKSRDLLSFAIDFSEEEQAFLLEMMQKKVNIEKAEVSYREALQRLLDREWMTKREEIRQKIQSGKISDEEALELAKVFDEIKRNRPQVNSLSG